MTWNLRSTHIARCEHASASASAGRGSWWEPGLQDIPGARLKSVSDLNHSYGLRRRTPHGQSSRSCSGRRSRRRPGSCRPRRCSPGTSSPARWTSATGRGSAEQLPGQLSLESILELCNPAIVTAQRCASTFRIRFRYLSKLLCVCTPWVSLARCSLLATSRQARTDPPLGSRG